MKLLSVEDARGRMLGAAARTGTESVALADGLGRVLAQTVSATRPQRMVECRSQAAQVAM